MSEISLPSASDALASLMANGNQFQTVPLTPKLMGDATFQHPRDGIQPVEADTRVVRATGQFYVADEQLRRAIQTVGGRADSLQSGADFVAQVYAQPGLVWGVSGYASIGHPCGAQAAVLGKFYNYLADGRPPRLVCDGAAGAGVLGISGVLAAEHGIDTLGVTPLEGMSSIAPRTHMVVYGDTYEQREVIVGLLADILVIVGGGLGAQREGIAALRNGGLVLLCNSTIAWQNVPEMALAVHDKRMLVWDHQDEIPVAAEKLRAQAERRAEIFRPKRLTKLRRRFAA